MTGRVDAEPVQRLDRAGHEAFAARLVDVADAGFEHEGLEASLVQLEREHETDGAAPGDHGIDLVHGHRVIMRLVSRNRS
jgi:hypothetical protein